LEQQLEAERAKKKRPRPSGDLLSDGASQSPRSGRAADSAARVAPLAPPLAPPLWRQLETWLGGRESAAALRRDLPSVCIVTRGGKRFERRVNATKRLLKGRELKAFK
jgi:hypothetical protein